MKNFFFFLLLLSAFGCGGGGGNGSDADTPISNGDNNVPKSSDTDYIASIPQDDTPVSDLAKAPSIPQSLPTLIILLEYDNQPIVSNDATWSNKFFGYDEGELNDYYDETSQGKFHLLPASENYNTQNDGIIKVHLSKNHIDTDIDGYDFFDLLAKDIADAIHKADNYIDFSRYDSNGDGALQTNELAIVLVVAGYEDAYAGRHILNGIWAHQSSLSPSQAPTADGVSIFNANKHGRYAVFGERHGEDTFHDATIGIIAHELGHAIFILPDLYNVNSQTGGIGIFGLMGCGSWGRKTNDEKYGQTPVHMSAWSKSYIGWITPQVLSNTSATLTQTASSEYNVIKIPISANHYYLLENRNDSGYDRGLRSLEGDFKGGMLIWHINQTKLTRSHIQDNDVNTDNSDKGVDVVEAVDPVLDYEANSPGNAKALFYNPNRTAFAPKVTDISAPGKLMYLNVH